VVTAANWSGRFALSDAARYGAGAEPVLASLRTNAALAALSAFCLDSELALDRSVRLRAMGVPESLVPTVLAIGSADDDRWQDVMPNAGFMVGTSRGLRSLYVVTPRLDATTFKTRLTQRLLAAARGGAMSAAGSA
jgi:hypothetical protein